MVTYIIEGFYSLIKIMFNEFDFEKDMLTFNPLSGLILKYIIENSEYINLE